MCHSPHLDPWIGLCSTHGPCAYFWLCGWPFYKWHQWTGPRSPRGKAFLLHRFWPQCNSIKYHPIQVLQVISLLFWAWKNDPQLKMRLWWKFQANRLISKKVVALPHFVANERLRERARKCSVCCHAAVLSFHQEIPQLFWACNNRAH